MSPTNDIMFSVLPVAAKAMITPDIANGTENMIMNG